MTNPTPMPRPADPRPLPADWVQSALAGVGLGTLVTDARGRVLALNPVAESLAGWPHAEAADRPLADVFRIEDEATRRPVPHPLADILAGGAAVGLCDHTVLIHRTGTERRIDHGVAPVHDPAGRGRRVPVPQRTDRRGQPPPGVP